MASLQQLSRKLRAAADILDDLLGTYISTRVNETPETAQQIRNTLPRVSRAITKVRHKHWMQTAAGKRKMSLVQKEAWKRRRERERAS